jgi:Glycosyl transferases group 1
MRLLVVHPGADSSTTDVEAGLCFGLQHHGCQVWRYRLDLLLEPSRRWLFSAWRALKKVSADQDRPTDADIALQASKEAFWMAQRRHVDAVIIVSAMNFHPLVVQAMRDAKIPVYVLFTESPYFLQEELDVAKVVDGCWTNERTCVPAFRAVQPNSGYVPHGWHPERHRVGLQPGDLELPAHDVVFVGTAFPERVAWFEAVDWTGIDLGLYGNWEMLPSRHSLRQYVKAKRITNRAAAGLYRRAKIGLNLYRETPAGLPPAESLNPRAYELAACGVCTVSSDRAEVRELFGQLMPAPSEVILRDLLGDAERREAIRQALPAAVASASWVERAQIILGDLQFQRAA